MAAVDAADNGSSNQIHPSFRDLAADFVSISEADGKARRRMTMRRR
ncbi:hypothetical protein LINPERHAP1_LOCUS19396 [Linum perenne]